MDKLEMTSIQEGLLRKVVVHAYNTTEFYRKEIDRSNIDMDRFEFSKDFTKLPIVNKQDILKYKEDFISSYRGKYRAKPQSSGGTTGTTLDFILDESGYLLREAEVLNYWKRHGYIVGEERTVMYRAGVLVPSSRKLHKPWRHDYARKMLYLSSYYSSPFFFKEYAELLQKWKPKYMHALPSAAYMFAVYLLENGICIPLKKFFSASEMLYPYQKEVLEQAFNCKVVEHYGHSEPGIYAAGQCNLGHFHITPSNVYTEVTLEGDILETSLTNFSMPFIRYRIGDKADGIHHDMCGCGLTSPYIKKIEGRDSEVIVTGDGRMISTIGFDQIFRGSYVQLGQIIQTKAGELTLKVIPSLGFDLESKEKILSELRDRVGTKTKISFFEVDAIPLEKSGKFRMIKSEVKLNECQ
jgi:phenylacetate-CoA ligase